MPGKSYTMREMKQIVDYLTENKVYNEIRGRKMWMDFANSGRVDRTWQSLKETFLKRILPDIHNPYYRLTIQQISSFRQECDLEAKHLKAKLETYTVGDDSNSTGDNTEKNQPSTSKNDEGDNTSGENIRCKKIQTPTRSSTETLVLEHDEDTDKDSESDGKEKTAKSFRDCIAYSEPLTPMLQEVLDDFATDEDEPRMQIVEEPAECPGVDVEQPDRQKAKSPLEIRESQSLLPTKVAYKATEEGLLNKEGKDVDKTLQPLKCKTLKLKKTQKGIWEYKECGNSSDGSLLHEKVNLEKNNNVSRIVTKDDNINKINASDPIEKNTGISPLKSGKDIIPAENCSNNTTDNLFTNNQDVLTNNSSETQIPTEGSTSELHTENKKTTKTIKLNRKRSLSQPTTKPIRKLSKDKDLPATDVGSDKPVKNKDTVETVASTEEILLLNNKVSEIDLVTPDIHYGKETPTVNLVTQEKNTEMPNDQHNIESTRSSDVIENTEENQNNVKEHDSQEAGPSGVSNLQNVPEINPCLKSVSLFAEIFSTQKLVESESDLEDTDNKIPGKKKKREEMSHENDSQKMSEDTCLDGTSHGNDNNEKCKNDAEIQEKVQENSTVINGKSKNSTVINGKSKNSTVINGKSKNVGCDKNGNNENIKDVVLLESHSESDSDIFQPPPAKRNNDSHTVSKTERINALSNILGFTSGGALQKRNISCRDKSSLHSKRNRTHSGNNAKDIETASSDYSTLSESETSVQSPPPPRKHGLKYSFGANDAARSARTTHARARSPLASISFDGGSEDEYDYWKSKFLVEKRKCAEEKIRADELARLLKETKELLQKGAGSPVLQLNSTLAPNCFRNSFAEQIHQINPNDSAKQPELQVGTQNYPKGNNQVTNEEKAAVEHREDKPLKVKLTNNAVTNDNVIEFECPMPHMDPVLEKIALLFHKRIETTDVVAAKPAMTARPTEQVVVAPSAELLVVSSGRSTPMTIDPVQKTQDSTSENQQTIQSEVLLDNVSTNHLLSHNPEAHESVNKKEDEIFKEIAERDKFEVCIEPSQAEDNVNKKKRGRPKKTSTSRLLSSISVQSAASKSTDQDKSTVSKQSPRKKIKTSNISQQDGSDIVLRSATKAKASINGDETMSEVTNSRSTEGLSVSGSESSKKRSRGPPKKYADGVKNGVKKKRATSKPRAKSATRKPKVDIPEDDSQVLYMLPKSVPASQQNISSRYVTKTPKILSSPDNSSRNSVDSTLGYQDSDVSPVINVVRRKRRQSLSTLLSRGRQWRNKIRKSYPYLADVDSNESNKSSIPVKSANIPNSSLNTEAYRSESYQLLLPKIKITRLMDKIDETEPTQNHVHETNTRLSVDVDNHHIVLTRVNSTSSKTDGNTSNVSLPLSPELSVVENISINKDFLCSVDYHPTINETQCNVESRQETDKYFISSVDVTVPLMEQDCQLQKSHHSERIDSNIISSDTSMQPIDTVNAEVKEQTTDSLHIKLKNLLLESAKKTAEQVRKINNGNDKETAMEVDAALPKTQKKARAKKRCSTPCKKKNVHKTKGSNVGPVLEEHTESCSNGGRKSNPPLFVDIVNRKDAMNVEENSGKCITKTTAAGNRKGRKKDIIKVKIQRPIKKKRPCSCSRMSTCTDSGINDTESGVFLGGCDDSVELIHNHSETCLDVNEYICDSVEIIENKSKSVISLDSCTRKSSDDKPMTCLKEHHENNHCPMPEELFCNNAQDGTNLNADKPAQETDDTGNLKECHNSFNNSFNSLITEDLSDEPNPSNPSNWCLWDEETANTVENSNGGVGANLNQIFPITCTVPNLSTITECTESDSRKHLQDTDTEKSVTEVVAKRSIFDI